MKYPKVVAVQAQDDFVLDLRFDNGTTKSFDAKPMLDLPIYKPLNDPAIFQHVSIDMFGGITWGNNIDCCCDTLDAQGVLS